MHVPQVPWSPGNSASPASSLRPSNTAVTPQLDSSGAFGNSSTSMFVSTKNNVPLQTARAHVSRVEPPGSPQNVRMIFDSCYVTESLQKSLGLLSSGSDTLLIKNIWRITCPT